MLQPAGTSRRPSARPRGRGDRVRARPLVAGALRLTRARLRDAGRPDEAETRARDALATVEPTDLLDLHGDALLDLAHVLRSAGRFDESSECVEAALALYERKANIVSAEWARAYSARGHVGVTPSRSAIAGSTGRCGSGGT